MKKLYLLLVILMISTISLVVLDYFDTSSSYFDFIKDIAQLVTFGLLIANCLVAALIWYQLHQSNNHFLELNRAWIHLDLGHVNTTSYSFKEPHSDTHYPLFLVNRGNLTALDVEIVFLKDESAITDGYLENIPENIQFNSIPPNFKYRMINDVSWLISDSNYLVYSISYKFNGETYKNKAFITNSGGLVPNCTDKMPSKLIK